MLSMFLQSTDLNVENDVMEAMPAQDSHKLEEILPKRKADNHLPEREKYEALCRGDPGTSKLTPKRYFTTSMLQKTVSSAEFCSTAL